MPDQPTRIMKAVSKIPYVHLKCVPPQLRRIITTYTTLIIRGTGINKTFNLTFCEDGASWHFDVGEKDPEKAIHLFYSQPNNSLVFLRDYSESCWISQYLPVCQL